MRPIVITKQPEMEPLSIADRLTLQFMVEQYEERMAESGGLLDGPYREARGIADCIAYFTGTLHIVTPPGGVREWLPTLHHILKED